MGGTCVPLGHGTSPQERAGLLAGLENQNVALDAEIDGRLGPAAVEIVASGGCLGEPSTGQTGTPQAALLTIATVPCTTSMALGSDLAGFDAFRGWDRDFSLDDVEIPSRPRPELIPAPPGPG